MSGVRLVRAILGFLLVVTALAAAGRAAPVKVEGAVNSVPLVQGKAARVAVKITIDPAYHIQSATPHDASLVPTSVKVIPMAGIAAEVPRYPVAEEILPPGAFDGPMLSVYEHVVYVLVPVTVAADAPVGTGSVVVSVTTQACDASTCLPPATTKVSIPVTIAAAGTAVAANQAEMFAAADAQKFAAPIATAPAATVPAAVNAATVPAAAGISVPLLSVEEQLALIQVRPYKPYNHGEHDYSLGLIILFALLGGVILNVMPCVLPVIPLKVLSLVQQAHGDRRAAVMHALSFSAGVISLFVALAVVLKVGGLFYGQQFQSPGFLIAMVMFVVALALSMMNVWTINPPRAVYAVDGGGTGHLGSFTSGLMATLLATPCSAPYLGPVLAWALIQPAWVTALALGLVGVGMSLPYLILAAFPAGLNRLPRAGRWSELLKQGLGIVMIGVAVYLITLLPNVTMWPWVLLGAVVVGLVCWGWGQLPSATMEAGRVWGIRAVVVMVGLGLGAVLYGLARRADVSEPVVQMVGESAVLPEKTTNVWLPFNVALLDAALKEGRPVVVDWTASWCINCRYLEASVLSTEAVQEAFRKGNVILLRADLSQDNPPASKLNEKLGGEAIPVLAIFSARRGYEPVVLRDNYSKGRVVEEVLAAR